MSRRRRRWALRRCIIAVVLLPVIVVTGCAGSELSVTPTTLRPWIEEEVTFALGTDELYGILTLPVSDGPHPAIAIVSGSADVSTGVRSGVSSQYFINHARKMVLNGFAVLRYDPLGVGRSTGQSGMQTLDLRAEEVAAAVRYLRSRPDIHPDRVGLIGSSQGGWVVAKTASRYQQEVAFIISVSGSGVSVAEQQIYSIEAQSRAAGMSEEEVSRALLFGRLLVDWQLADPIYRDANKAATQTLGEGPWTDFTELVYESGGITAAEGLRKGIGILESVQDEPWARFLYLEELYLPQLQRIPPEQVEALRTIAAQNLLEDPAEYWTRVQCPVLAVFGEDDLLQPTVESAALYHQYVTAAGNTSFSIVVLPDVGHSIGLSTPGYWEALSDWLDRLYPE